MFKHHNVEIEELDLGSAQGETVEVANAAATEVKGVDPLAEELAAIVASELDELGAPVFSAFDYTGIDPTIADEARQAADRIRARIRASVIDVGKDLLAIKDKLGHGKFGTWLAAEFNMSERWAQNCMAVARIFGTESAIISVLPASTLCKLAASSTPATVRQAVLSDLRAGKSLKAKEIERAIKLAKDEERKRQETEKEESRQQALPAKETSEEANKLEAAETQAKDRELGENSQGAKGQPASPELMKKVILLLRHRLGHKFEAFRVAIKQVDALEFQKAVLQAPRLRSIPKVIEHSNDDGPCAAVGRDKNVVSNGGKAPAGTPASADRGTAVANA